MTTTERLAAAARSAAELFPAGDDLPPLRIPAQASRRTRRAHPDRRPGTVISTGRSRNWLAPLAAATAVAVVAGVVGTIALREHASETGNPGGSSAGADSHRQSSSSQAQTARQHAAAEQQQHRQLNALVLNAYVPATGPQYDAGTKLIWMIRSREAQAAARCLAKLGYHNAPEVGPFNLADFADNTQWPDLPRITRTHEFVPLSGTLGPTYSKAEQAADGTCMKSASARYTPLNNAGMAVETAWWPVVARIQSSAKVQAAIPALNACARRYGFPNAGYGRTDPPLKSYADFMGWVAGFLDGATSRGATTATMQSLDRHWTTVFATCAGPIVGIFQRLQAAARPGFLSQHASQLRRIDELAWHLLGSG